MTEARLEIHGPVDDWPEPKEPLGEHLLRRLEALGETTVLTYAFTGEHVVASALAKKSAGYAAALVARGVRPNDVVLLCFGRHVELSSLMLGTLLAGASLAILNHNFDSGDYEQLLGVLQPRIIFTIPETEERLRSVFPRLEFSPKPDLILLTENPSWEAFQKDAGTLSTSRPTKVVTDLKKHVGFVMCSSGTTGLPKGVCLTHYNMHAQIQLYRRPDSLVKYDDVVVITSPAYWVTGIIFMLGAMDVGYKVVNVYGAKEEQFLEAIQTHKATTVFTASNFLMSVIKHPSFRRYDLSSLRFLTCGGASMSAESQLLMEEQFKAPIYQWYGMTEMLVAAGSRKGTYKRGSVGKISPYQSFRVVDSDSGRVLPRGSQGELQFKGPMVSPGYLRNPTATAATFTSDGWLCSGDLGYADDEEFLFITGRIKDLIKYRGDHIAPTELESILLTHGEVQDAAVVAIPHETDQEWPRAYVVLQPGAKVTAQELEDLVKDQVAGHKWLRGGVHFLEALPKASTGKTSRVELRRLYVHDK